MVNPPSTSNVSPVIYEAFIGGQKKDCFCNILWFAFSPQRGTRSANSSLCLNDLLGHTCRQQFRIFVRTLIAPGATPFIRIPNGARSSAKHFTI